MRKAGFFGGTFDPIHFGHLNLAIQIMEKADLDEVVFCPAHISPHKGAKPPHVADKHRLSMVKLAIAPIPKFSVIDWELERPGPSYTIDTVRRLIAEKPHVKWHLILGEDALADFDQWKQPDELVALAPPLIGTRPGSFKSTPQKRMIEIPLMDISSTILRSRLCEKKFCGHMIPEKVLDYIARHKLY